jgi:hypothetical protein
LPNWFREIYLADQALQLLAATKGPVMYHYDINSAWVKNKNSISKVYFTEKNFPKVLKNDHKIINRQIGDNRTSILSYKSIFHKRNAAKYF